jgi:4'-phosphopantetheinyl transferase EntD
LTELLLPDGVAVRECRVADARDTLTSKEEQCVASAVGKRRREFTAGRFCARAALAALGVGCDSLLSNPDRTPAWPRGVVGSITHSDQLCAAAVGFAASYEAIGIDIEETSRLDRDLLPMICTQAELTRIAALPAELQQAVGTVVFSAKEAFYKCQYTLTRSWVGFHNVSIELGPGPHEFRAMLLSPVGAFRDGTLFRGRYALENGSVATAMAIEAGSLKDS